MIARAQIRTETSEFGVSVRATREPDPRLRPLLHRGFYGLELRDAGFVSWLEPPRPLVTLMVDLSGSIRADGRPLPSAWVGGLGERATLVGLDCAGYTSLDIQLTPLGALTVFGQPLAELGGECIALEHVFGAAGRELCDRVRSALDWDTRFDLLEQFLLASAAKGPAPTPAVAWAYARIQQTAGNIRVGAMAAELGCSRRYLTSRFGAELGLAPKTVARQVRFAKVCERMRRDPDRIAEIAVDAGYYDQAHLNRDFREMAGITPTAFLSRLIPGGGIVGDGLR